MNKDLELSTLRRRVEVMQRCTQGVRSTTVRVTLCNAQYEVVDRALNACTILPMVEMSSTERVG